MSSKLLKNKVTSLITRVVPKKRNTFVSVLFTSCNYQKVRIVWVLLFYYIMHLSVFPSIQPTANPSINPSIFPTTNPSISPSVFPTFFPTTSPPTTSPTTSNPTSSPSTNPSTNPSIFPTRNPVWPFFYTYSKVFLMCYFKFYRSIWPKDKTFSNKTSKRLIFWQLFTVCLFYSKSSILDKK